MMRFEDTLPPGTEAEWSCGHVGGAVCKEQRANALAEEKEARSRGPKFVQEGRNF
jgi:hypothetical protein